MPPTDWRNAYPQSGRKDLPPPPPRAPQSRLAQFLGVGSAERRPGIAGWLIPRTIVGLAAWALVAAALLGVMVAFAFAANQARISEREQATLGKRSGPSADLDVPSPGPTSGASPSPSPRDPLAEMVTAVGKSVVLIEDADAQGGVTTGSGFVLQQTPSDIWVVTSYSVVRAAQSQGRPVSLRMPNFQRLPGTVKSVDRDRDLALVIVDGERLPGIKMFAPPAAQGAKVFVLATAPESAKVVGVQATVSQVVDTGFLLESSGPAIGAGGPVLDADGNLVGVLPGNYLPRGQKTAGAWVVPAELMCRRLVVCPAGVRASPTPSPSPSPS